MSARPSISVVIPHYNQNAYLEQALQSIARQKYLPSEVIVVDDGSDKPPVELVAFYNTKFPVKLLRHDINRGVSAARNTGIGAATGEFIALLDADDFWAPEHLSGFVECTGRHDIRFYSAQSVYGYRRRNELLSEFLKHPCFREDYFHLAVGNALVVNSSNVIFHRKVFERTGLFDEDLPVFEDLDFWMRAGKQYPLFFMPVTLVFIRSDTPGSLTKRPELYERMSIMRFFERHLTTAKTAEQKHFVQQNILGTLLNFRYWNRPAPAWLESMLDMQHLSPLEKIKWKMPAGMFRFLRYWIKQIRMMKNQPGLFEKEHHIRFDG